MYALISILARSEQQTRATWLAPWPTIRIRGLRIHSTEQENVIKVSHQSCSINKDNHTSNQCVNLLAPTSAILKKQTFTRHMHIKGTWFVQPIHRKDFSRITFNTKKYVDCPFRVSL